jgi:hypothetical protein
MKKSNKTNNGQQNTTQKTIQRTTRTKLKMLVNSCTSELFVVILNK